MTDNKPKLDNLNNLDLSKIAYTEQVIQDIEKTCPGIRDILNGSVSYPGNVLNKAAQSQIDSMVNSIKIPKIQFDIPKISNPLTNLADIDLVSTEPVVNVGEIANNSQRNVQVSKEISNNSHENVQVSKEIVAALHVLIKTVGEIKRMNDVASESNKRMESLTVGMLMLAIGTLVFGIAGIVTDLFATSWGWVERIITIAISGTIAIVLLIFLIIILHDIRQIKREKSKT